MRRQSKSKMIYQVLIAVGVIALFVHLGQDLMHQSQCSTDYYLSRTAPPPNHVVTTVDGAVVRDTYVPVDADAKYQQFQAEAGARFTADGCNAGDFAHKP